MLVINDVVNVMAAYQPVVQACDRTLAQQASLGEDGRSVSCCQVAILCVIPRDYFEENIYQKVSFVVREK